MANSRFQGPSLPRALTASNAQRVTIAQSLPQALLGRDRRSALGQAAAINITPSQNLFGLLTGSQGMGVNLDASVVNSILYAQLVGSQSIDVVEAASVAGGGGGATWGTTITSVPFEAWFRSDLNVSVSGGSVDTWGEQKVGASRNISNTSTARPTFTASDATLNNLPTVNFARASAQVLKATSGYNWLPNGTAAGYYYRAIVKQTTWLSGQAIFGCGSNTVFALTATPSVRMNATTASVNSNANLVLTTWRRLEVFFNNSAPNDFLKIGATLAQAGSTAGVGTTSALFGLGGVAAGTSNWDGAIAEFCCTLGLPSSGERTALDSLDSTRYGAGVLT
jgi:hypothetical protein